jgi:hypothetical protein
MIEDAIMFPKAKEMEDEEKLKTYFASVLELGCDMVIMENAPIPNYIVVRTFRRAEQDLPLEI